MTAALCTLCGEVGHIAYWHLPRYCQDCGKRLPDGARWMYCIACEAQRRAGDAARARAAGGGEVVG